MPKLWEDLNEGEQARVKWVKDIMETQLEDLNSLAFCR